jgi:HAE1 family hydrophobic/amphiphilic exporter-1
VVGGGLIVSQTLTLYVMPVFYIYMEHLQEWLARRKMSREPAITSRVGAAAE